jgi:beta-phosphoglucomutase
MVCHPSFQHCYALSRLKREGYKLAVCSNSIRHTVELMMSLSELDRYLEFSLSNEDVKRPKPESDIYDLAIANLGLLPKEVLIVEDNENGVEAAKRSGAHVLMVSGVDDVTYGRLRESIRRLSQPECRG